jgi:hypothetical protein
VYPNPYIKGKSSGEKIYFSNLPKESTLRIFTLSADPVAALRHDQSVDGGVEIWDISCVPGGVYVYSIVSSKGTVRGKISIIK